MKELKKKHKEFNDGYKKFITKGNIVDMAVGVVIGTAFTAIVNSLVKDIITPCLSKITGNVDFTELKVVLDTTKEVYLTYGNFIQAIINFLLISFSIYVVLRIIRSGNRKKEEAEALRQEALAKEKAEKDAILKKEQDELILKQQQMILDRDNALFEIRDLLKAQATKEAK